MCKKQPVKHFNDIEILDDSGKLNSTPNQYEKIRLEFSILHANKGSYSIQANLYDQQVFDFFSETKKVDTKQTLVFGNFFNCNFYFQKEQKLFVTLNKNNNPFKIEITLGCIVGSKDCTFSQNFFNDESLVIKAEKLNKEEDLLDLKFNLKEINSDPNFFVDNEFYYLITSRRIDIYESSETQKDGSFIPVHIPTNLLQPSYTVSFYSLSNNQLVFKYERSIKQIKNNGQFKKQISLPNNRYILLEDNSEIIKNYTFIDYIKSGVKIALSIGIDFTASNGDPKDYLFKTLHSLKGQNAYERAITSCGKIVGNYDYDQLFPVYGFGAIVNSSFSKEALMCFNLNLTNDPNIKTIDNVIKTYHDIIENDRLTFAGPTEFTPLIKEVISRMNKNDILEYHILLILTDGVIDDLQQTIDILVEASTLPLSVIIVGIGKADFKNMKILDGDEIPLTSSKGEERMRDLVQFVPFSKYQNNAEQLSMEVLAEIPRQIVEYYQYKKLNPSKIEAFTQTRRVIGNVNIINKLKAHLQSEVRNYTKNFESKFVENPFYFDILNQQFKNNNEKGNFSNRLNININNKSNNHETNTLHNKINSNISLNSGFKNFNNSKNSNQNTSKVNIANQNSLTNKYGNFNQSNFNNQYNPFINNNNNFNNFNNRPYNQSKNIIMNNKININPNNIHSNLIIGGYNIHNDITKKVINKINKP